MKPQRSNRTGWRSYSLFFLLLVVGASQGCVSGASLGARRTVELPYGDASHAVSWFAPLLEDDGLSLNRWRKSVGPPVIPSEVFEHDPQDVVTVVSWNTAVGDADIVSFVRSRVDQQRPLVMLLQEVYRAGAGVPDRLETDSAFAGRLGRGARAG